MSKIFVKGTGGLCVALILVTLLFSAKCSKATSVEINNSSSFFQCSHGSSINDCLDEGLDFVMGSEAVSDPLDISKTNDPIEQAVAGCGRRPYRSCVPKPNSPKVPPHCYDGVYPKPNRDCQ